MYRAFDQSALGREDLQFFNDLAIPSCWQSRPQFEQAGRVRQICDLIMGFRGSHDELLRYGPTAGMARGGLLGEEAPARLEPTRQVYGAEVTVRGLPSGAFAF